MYQRILRLALPAIVSNITVPLLGLVDTAIVGHLGSAVFMGAIAVGSTIFSVVYWLFGFLRAGTAGFTSQSMGARCVHTVCSSLVRALVFAAIVALLLLLFQAPLCRAALALLAPDSSVAVWARVYYNICIWGAPAVLMLYGLNGWFVGLQAMRFTMVVAVVQNVANVAFSLFFVFVLRLQVAGVALGTLLAQYVGLFLALFLVRFLARRRSLLGVLWLQVRLLVVRPRRTVALYFGRGSRFFSVHRDLFLRTLCILSVTTWFTAAGARQGNLTLAANALLLQLFYFFSYFVDGFAGAGEALAGACLGGHTFRRLRVMLRCLFRIGLGLGLVFTAAYALLMPVYLHLMTAESAVVHTASDFAPWVSAIPLVSFAAFLWDGVYAGLTRARPMFFTMALSALAFFAVYFVSLPALGGHALWMAFCVFLLLRSVLLTMHYRLRPVV